MYYASFGLLAVIHHIIINHHFFNDRNKETEQRAHYWYRMFLNCILAFYIVDLIWGFLEELRIRPLVYADTVLFFILMALSVLLWTRFVVAYLDKTGIKSNLLIAGGWVIFGFVILNLVINFFYPVIFTFTEDAEYIPESGRYVFLVAQLLMFIVISVYSLIISIRSTGNDRVHYRTVCLSGGVMALFIVIQTFYPFAPFYTIGCFTANCLVHIFVEEDEKKEMDRITEQARAEKERYSQVANSLASDYDAIYYINIETGRYLEISVSESYEALNVPKTGEDFFSETRENALRYAHPDDRDFAVSMYYRDTMLRNLKGRKSYSYEYRIMAGDEARYYRFVVMLSDDEKHFVVCDKDIHDTITAETALLEKQRIQITFSQIAESLASNYDVIYYVDINTGDYVGFTAHDIYGELKVNETGNDFFKEVSGNVEIIIHPQDRERIKAIVNKDHMLTVLEERKQLDAEYRMIVNNTTRYTRLSCRKSSDGEHFIIGVENIDDEVRKEREHLRALNSEKELARRDELTGIRNKTAFAELEQSVQNNMDKGIDYLPFAIVVCDLNDLKRINDTRGHKAGDEYIRSSAKLLCDVFDHSPIFRIGGDEFVVFLRGDDYTSRKELISTLRKEVQSNLDKHEGPVIAVGMAEYEPDSDTEVSEVFNRADHMMYEDKRKLKSSL